MGDSAVRQGYLQAQLEEQAALLSPATQHNLLQPKAVNSRPQQEGVKVKVCQAACCSADLESALQWPEHDAPPEWQ